VTSSATSAIGGSKATGGADSKGVEGLSGDMKAVSMTTADSKEISSRAAGSKVCTRLRSFISSSVSECDNVLFVFVLFGSVKRLCGWWVGLSLLNAVRCSTEEHSTLLYSTVHL
jgi:hypothetical protein